MDMTSFINGLIVGITGTLIVLRMYIGHKTRQIEREFRNDVKNAIDKLLKETKDDLPIEKEENDE